MLPPIADTMKNLLFHKVVCTGSADAQNILNLINRIGSLIKLNCVSSHRFFGALIHAAILSSNIYVHSFALFALCFGERFFSCSIARLTDKAFSIATISRGVTLPK
mgnify:CR=1 FL=1